MANITRNSTPTGSNQARTDFVATSSHLWSDDNTPWSPDDTHPWQDDTLSSSLHFSKTGVNLTRN